MKNILIYGIGLIGGSFAKALKSRSSDIKIYAIDSDDEAIILAQNEKIIENFSGNLSQINFDLIVIATPLSSYQEIFSGLKKSSAIIIDLGSLKEFTLNSVPNQLREKFIACHPIAGSEASGFAACDSDLFIDKKMIICKNAENSAEDIAKIVEIAGLIGMKTEFMEAKKHDEIYGLVSHLPQFLSFLTKEFSPEINSDFLRTAFRLNTSNPQIWTDIFKLNDKNIEKFYNQFFDNLMDFAQELSEDNFEFFLTECSDKKLEIELNAKVLFRFLIVQSYLKIDEIKSFKEYAGSGFKDFVLPQEIAKIDRNILLSALKKNKEKILEIIDEIS